MSFSARDQNAIRPAVGHDGTVTLRHPSMMFRVTPTELRCAAYDWSGRQPELRWPREAIAGVRTSATDSATGTPMARLALELRDGHTIELIRRAPARELNGVAEQLSAALAAPPPPRAPAPAPAPDRKRPARQEMSRAKPSPRAATRSLQERLNVGRSRTLVRPSRIRHAQTPDGLVISVPVTWYVMVPLILVGLIPIVGSGILGTAVFVSPMRQESPLLWEIALLWIALVAVALAAAYFGVRMFRRGRGETRIVVTPDVLGIQSPKRIARGESEPRIWPRDEIDDVSVHYLSKQRSGATLCELWIERSGAPTEKLFTQAGYTEQELEEIAQLMRAGLGLPPRPQRGATWLAATAAAAAHDGAARARALQSMGPKRSALQERETLAYFSAPTDAVVCERWPTGLRLFVPPVPMRELLLHDARPLSTVLSAIVILGIVTVMLINLANTPVSVCPLAIGVVALIASVAFAQNLFSVTRRTVVLEVDAVAGTLTRRQWTPHSHPQQRSWRLAEIRELLVKDTVMPGIRLRLSGVDPEDLLTVLSRRQVREIARNLRPALGFGPLAMKS
jgi:hypothetical protein